MPVGLPCTRAQSSSFPAFSVASNQPRIDRLPLSTQTPRQPQTAEGMLHSARPAHCARGCPAHVLCTPSCNTHLASQTALMAVRARPAHASVHALHAAQAPPPSLCLASLASNQSRDDDSALPSSTQNVLASQQRRGMCCTVRAQHMLPVHALHTC
jgi:hypothetical protein